MWVYSVHTFVYNVFLHDRTHCNIDKRRNRANIMWNDFGLWLHINWTQLKQFKKKNKNEKKNKDTKYSELNLHKIGIFNICFRMHIVCLNIREWM